MRWRSKKSLSAIMALTCAMAHAQTPSDQARETLRLAVAAGTALVDHIATIGGYEYEVYVDRSVVPIVVMATITSASMDRLLDAPPKRLGARLDVQNEQVARYLAQWRAGAPR